MTFHYHQPMKTPISAALLSTALSLACLQVHAQGSPAGQASLESRRQAAVNAQIFYQVLLGEMNAASGDTGAAISLLLDAARKTQDEKLFQRAVDLALGARSGEAALQVCVPGGKAPRGPFQPLATSSRF